MLTHVNEANQPAMVDISEKTITHREAAAAVEVVLPEVVMKRFADGDLVTKKGPVFATAIIAGTMAAKKTHELIPFCHQIPIDGCEIRIDVVSSDTVRIECLVRTTYKTGVEMEALTGANVAALTIYDMCKALSQDIVIQGCRLMSKKGGRHDVKR